jgi:hypothetical protein
MEQNRREPKRHHPRWFAAAALTAALALAGAAAAQPQPNTTRMSCAAAQQLVARHGALVLRTGASTFDRFVISRAFCMPTEITEPAFAPTADTRQCFVGYTCREPMHDMFP